MRVEQIVIRSDIHHDDLVRICNQSARFRSDIHVEYKTDELEHMIDAKSLLGMLVIPHKAGTAMRITAKGKDEEEALESMLDLFGKYV